MPASVSELYQGGSRAGRDELQAENHVMLSWSDRCWHRDKAADVAHREALRRSEIASHVRLAADELFAAAADPVRCRHQQIDDILRGQSQVDTCDTMCDNCESARKIRTREIVALATVARTYLEKKLGGEAQVQLASLVDAAASLRVLGPRARVAWIMHLLVASGQLSETPHHVATKAGSGHAPRQPAQEEHRAETLPKWRWFVSLPRRLDQTLLQDTVSNALLRTQRERHKHEEKSLGACLPE